MCWKLLALQELVVDRVTFFHSPFQNSFFYPHSQNHLDYLITCLPSVNQVFFYKKVYTHTIYLFLCE